MAESMVSIDPKSLGKVLVDKIKSEKEDMIFEQQVDSISKLRRLTTLLGHCTQGFTCTRNSKGEEQHKLDIDERFGCRSRACVIVNDVWKLIETSPFNGDPKCVAQTRAVNLSYARDSKPDGNTALYEDFMSCWFQAHRDLDASRNHYQSMLGDCHSFRHKIDVKDTLDDRDMALDILNGSAPGNEKEKIKEMSPKEGSLPAKKFYNQFDQGDLKEFPHSSACKSSIWLSTNGNMCVKNLNYVFVLISLFIFATLNPPSGSFLEGIFHGMGNSKGEFVNKPIVIRSAVSVAWIVSIISLISELQRDLYLLLSLAAIFLGYVGTILAIESPEALPMLKLGGLVLLLAAFMYLAFNRFPLRFWKWFCGCRRSNVDQPKSVNFKTVIAIDV